MGRTYHDLITFEDAERIYATIRKPVTAAFGISGKRLAGSTILHMIDEDTYAIRLYNTDIVKIHRDGTWSLATGGWNTPTTKERINRFSPARVFQEKWVVYVQSGNGWDKSRRHELVDGIRVNANGDVMSPVPS